MSCDHALAPRDALVQGNTVDRRFLKCAPVLFVVHPGLSHQGGQLPHAALRIPQKRFQLFSEIRHVVVAFFAVRVERVEDNVVGRRIELVPAQRRQHEFGIFDARFRTRQVGRQEGILSRQHFVDNRGKRPFVAASVQALLPHLLERHVADGSPARNAEAGRIRQRSQAEVGYLHLSLSVDEHVVRLNVQVKNLVVVRHLERMGYSREHGRHDIEREMLVVAPQKLRERHALHVLHDEVGR